MINLHSDIASLFGELDGYERYDAQLELFAWRRASAVARWNAANPERMRAAWNRYAAKVRAKNDPAWREKKRAYDRAYHRAYRARLKVAA